MIKFQVNGETFSTDHLITLDELVRYFNYNLALLVVEYNSCVIGKSNWKIIKIKSNDIVEIVTIVGGG